MCWGPHAPLSLPPNVWEHIVPTTYRVHVPKVPVGVRLDPAAVKILEAVAVETRTTRSAVVAKAVDAYLVEWLSTHTVGQRPT